MKLDHLAMYVEDLEGAKEFFIRFFAAETNEEYYNPQTGLRTYFLSFSGGSRLEIMTRPGLFPGGQEQFFTGYTHLAFSAGSRDHINAMDMSKDYGEVDPIIEKSQFLQSLCEQIIAGHHFAKGQQSIIDRCTENV